MATYMVFIDRKLVPPEFIEQTISDWMTEDYFYGDYQYLALRMEETTGYSHIGFHESTQAALLKDFKVFILDDFSELKRILTTFTQFGVVDI